MKNHYCVAEKQQLIYESQCSWCGEKEMNNEPVAWTACLGCGQRVTDDSIHTCSPQLKTLTDEEIDELANKYLYVLNDVPYANDIKDFARAILRKAQEK